MGLPIRVTAQFNSHVASHLLHAGRLPSSKWYKTVKGRLRIELSTLVVRVPQIFGHFRHRIAFTTKIVPPYPSGREHPRQSPIHAINGLDGFSQVIAVFNGRVVVPFTSRSGVRLNFDKDGFEQIDRYLSDDGRNLRGSIGTPADLHVGVNTITPADCDRVDIEQGLIGVGVEAGSAGDLIDSNDGKAVGRGRKLVLREAFKGGLGERADDGDAECVFGEGVAEEEQGCYQDDYLHNNYTLDSSISI